MRGVVSRCCLLRKLLEPAVVRHESNRIAEEVHPEDGLPPVSRLPRALVEGADPVGAGCRETDDGPCRLTDGHRVDAPVEIGRGSHLDASLEERGHDVVVLRDARRSRKNAAVAWLAMWMQSGRLCRSKKRDKRGGTDEVPKYVHEQGWTLAAQRFSATKNADATMCPKIALDRLEAVRDVAPLYSELVQRSRCCEARVLAQVCACRS